MKTQRTGKEKTITTPGIHNIDFLYKIMNENNLYLGEVDLKHIETFMLHHYTPKKDILPHPAWLDFLNELSVSSLELLHTVEEDKLLDTVAICLYLLKEKQKRPVMLHWFLNNHYHVHPGRARVKCLRFMGHKTTLAIIQTPKYVYLPYKKISNISDLTVFGDNIFFRDTLSGFIENSWRPLLEPIWFDKEGVKNGNYNFENKRIAIKSILIKYLETNDLSNETLLNYLDTQSLSW